MPFAMTPVAERGDTVQTSTGLEFLELAVGTGLEAAACMVLLVHVEGSLRDGSVFVSTRDAEPPSFVPGGQVMLPGLAEGLIGMREGGERRLIVPPQLAYGFDEDVTDDSGNIIVPRGSTVIFDLELLQINP